MYIYRKRAGDVMYVNIGGLAIYMDGERRLRPVIAKEAVILFMQHDCLLSFVLGGVTAALDLVDTRTGNMQAGQKL